MLRINIGIIPDQNCRTRNLATAPTVYINGFTGADLADLDAQIARNAAMGFSNMATESSESNGWETAEGASELTDIGLGSIEALQRGSNAAQMIEGGGELNLISETAGRAAGVGLSVASGIITTINAEKQYGHLRNSDKADLLIDGVQAGLVFFEVSSPIGWAFSVGMFVGNLVSEHYTGKSITENLFANDNN